MRRATARLWREHAACVVQIDVDGAPYMEREYPDVAAATDAIRQILRQKGERSISLDENECEFCEEPLDLRLCSQCGVDAFVRTCQHEGAVLPIRTVEGALYCRRCRA